MKSLGAGFAAIIGTFLLLSFVFYYGSSGLSVGKSDGFVTLQGLDS
jgi:hypothetical protein